MWWRFIIFCLLVTLTLFVVLSCIHGRPLINLIFRRCCGEDIENDQAIYENFGNNFLRERLIGAETLEAENGTLVPEAEMQEKVGELVDKMREILNVHDPKFRNRTLT